MAIVTVEISTVAKPNPADPGFGAFDHYDYFLYMNEDPLVLIQQISSPDTTISFPDDVPPGNYMVEVMDADAGDHRFETEGVRQTFSVPSSPGTYPGVSGITITLS